MVITVTRISGNTTPRVKSREETPSQYAKISEYVKVFWKGRISIIIKLSCSVLKALMNVAT